MLDDHALEDLLGGGDPPPPVTMMNPLRVEFEPAVFARLLRAALHQRGARVVPEEDSTDAVERLRLLDLMEWANGQREPIQLDVFPAGEYGTDDFAVEGDDEGDDDEEPDFPF
jgi:hypothetical protein